MLNAHNAIQGERWAELTRFLLDLGEQLVLVGQRRYEEAWECCFQLAYGVAATVRNVPTASEASRKLGALAEMAMGDDRFDWTAHSRRLAHFIGDD